MSNIRKQVVLTPVSKPLEPLLKDKLEAIEKKLINIEKILSPEVYNYFYNEDTVVKGDSKTYRFKEQIGRDSKNGYIINDGYDAIYIKINDGLKITLKSGEQFTWGTPIGGRIIIRKLEVLTESSSSQPFRVFAV